MSDTKSGPQRLSFDDLTGKRRGGSPGAAPEYGNVHLLVEDFVRNTNGIAQAVQGINLKTGEEMTIRLAAQDQFVKLYTPSNRDLSVRQASAAKTLARRPPMADMGNPRSKNSVPIGGVVTLDEVRKDYDSGDLYARWPTGLVHIPSDEKARTGMFEVRTSQGKDRDGVAFTSTYVQQLETRAAVQGRDATQGRLDEIFSGILPGTEAPMRTWAAVAIRLGEEVKTYGLRSPQRKEGDDYLTVPGVGAALSGEHKRLSAPAAVALASLSGSSFDSLRFAVDDDSIRDNLRQLYVSIRDGDVDVAVIPGALFSPTRFQSDAFLGFKVGDDGNRKEAKTQDSALVDRGYFPGIVGVRHVAQRSGITIEPVVKAIQSDMRLPDKTSDNFVRLDMQAVGEMGFRQAYAPTPQAGLAAGITAAARPALAVAPAAAPPPDEDNFGADSSEDFEFGGPS